MREQWREDRARNPGGNNGNIPSRIVWPYDSEPARPGEQQNQLKDWLKIAILAISAIGGTVYQAGRETARIDSLVSTVNDLQRDLRQHIEETREFRQGQENYQRRERRRNHE